MKIISWNVAGLRAVLKKGFRDYFKNINADIFCIQEVKALKEQYDFNPPNYYEYLFPAQRKGYSGILVYSKIKPLNVIYGINEKEYDDEGRVITLEYNNFYLVNVYVPNSKEDLSRLSSRIYFNDIFKNYLLKLNKIKPVIICGDFNVAHQEIDIKDYKSNQNHAGFTIDERNKFSELLSSGFIDTYRYFNPNKENIYTWWNYMYKARERNKGWRIDYILISKKIIDKVKDTMIFSNIYGSDHCPIGLDIII